MASPTADHCARETVVIDATVLKAHRAATRLGAKGKHGHIVDRAKFVMNTKLHAIFDIWRRAVKLY